MSETRIFSFTVGPRYTRQQPNGLRPFQQDAINALLDPQVKTIIIEAPVGSGKSYIVYELLRQQLTNQERSLTILTYPTMALMESQLSSMQQVIPELSIWNGHRTFSEVFQNRGVNAFYYSTQSVMRYICNQNLSEKPDKELLINKALSHMQMLSKRGAVVTTPDVLDLMHLKAYGKRVVADLVHSVIFFDEFHLYYGLPHFLMLVHWLIEELKCKVVFMSATTIFEREMKDFINELGSAAVHLKFDSSAAEANGVIFNHPLTVKVHQLRYTNIEKLIAEVEPVLSECEKPAAILFDSIFRLKKVVPCLQDRLGKDFDYREYHGMDKNSLKELSKKTIIWATSSLEVGVDFKDLATLISEVSNWPSAIQRLGRVGRHRPGTAHLLTSRDFAPAAFELGSKCSRDDFEKQALTRTLPEPRKACVSDEEMFRGDSYNFMLVDRETNEVTTYSQNLFAMFQIDGYCDCWRRLSWDEKKTELRKFGIPEWRHRELLLRDLIFPFWGIIEGRFRDSYVNFDYTYDQDYGILRIKPEDSAPLRFEGPLQEWQNG